MPRSSAVAEPPTPGVIDTAATLESTADGILVVDLEGRVTSYNRKFASMWRLPEKVLATGQDERLIENVHEHLKDPEAFLPA